MPLGPTNMNEFKITDPTVQTAIEKIEHGRKLSRPKTCYADLTSNELYRLDVLRQRCETSIVKDAVRLRLVYCLRPIPPNYQETVTALYSGTNSPKEFIPVQNLNHSNDNRILWTMYRTESVSFSSRQDRDHDDWVNHFLVEGCAIDMSVFTKDTKSRSHSKSSPPSRNWIYTAYNNVETHRPNILVMPDTPIYPEGNFLQEFIFVDIDKVTTRQAFYRFFDCHHVIGDVKFLKVTLHCRDIKV